MPLRSSLVPFPVGTQIGTLTIDANGDIFGTTVTGGANNDGTVFEIVKTATGYASAPITLASFTPADGQLTLNHPKTLIVDANGNLFGTTDPSTQAGGNTGGVVFEIVKTSTAYEFTPTIVADFNGLADGSLGANLVADANGNLFGTTQAGGANNKGSAFEITNSGFAPTPSVTPKIVNICGRTQMGQAAIWQVNGTNVVGAAWVGANPGPDWKTVGTGDFNDDGQSDILWQNTSGQVAIWEMDGTNQIAGGSQWVGANPGPDWKTVGTGDFNGDGKSDILFQNTNGQVAIWEMDGTNPIAGGSQWVGANPGPDWKVVGTGDFNGDGKSDILFQNTDGQAAIWEMERNQPDRRRQSMGRRQSRPGLESGRDGRLQRRRQIRYPVSKHGRPGCDLGNERNQPDRRRQSMGRRQSWAGLESGRDGRLQWRRQIRYPVSKHGGSGGDLGNGRNQPDRRRQSMGRPQSWAKLARY